MGDEAAMEIGSSMEVIHGSWSCWWNSLPASIDGTRDRNAVTVIKNRRDPWTITFSNGCRISCRFPLETSSSDVGEGDDSDAAPPYKIDAVLSQSLVENVTLPCSFSLQQQIPRFAQGVWIGGVWRGFFNPWWRSGELWGERNAEKYLDTFYNSKELVLSVALTLTIHFAAIPFEHSNMPTSES